MLAVIGPSDMTDVGAAVATVAGAVLLDLSAVAGRVLLHALRLTISRIARGKLRRVMTFRGIACSPQLFDRC